jgi:hypothetical protein
MTSDDEWGEGGYVITGSTLRVCADLCSTCIFHPGNRMRLAPGRVKSMVDGAAADEGHIVCHSTLGTDEPAICAGFERHPVGGARSLALRLARAGVLAIKRITPPSLKGRP